MFRLFGVIAAMAIPVLPANGAEPGRHAGDEPVQVCEALPNDVPIEQSLVTDPTVRYPIASAGRQALRRDAQR